MTKNVEERAALLSERKEGKEEGLKQKTVEIAKKMLIKGADLKYIIEITGLTKEEIEKLK